MCCADMLTSQLLELSKQLATSSKSFRVTLRTKDINSTCCSQDVPHPAQDESHPGAPTTAKKKKTKSPSQKKRDFERKKLFLLKKLETTESTKPSQEGNTSDEIDEPQESFQCEICDMKATCKVSLGKHMHKDHSTIPQFDGLEDSEVKGLDPCPLCKDALEVPDHGNCGKWGSHGVGFSGGNCDNCHIILNIKGKLCEAICNDIVKKVCERCKLHCKTLY